MKGAASMEWLSDLIKHITISRSFTGAVFFTSGSLLTGPKWFPAYFEPLPKDWIVPATGALIFSGVLLLFWFLPVAWTVGTKTLLWIPQYLHSRRLNAAEEALMFVLADVADEYLNLANLDYASGKLSKLEVLALSSSLSRKGLVRINEYDENLIRLSPQGRQRALELRRSVAK